MLSKTGSLCSTEPSALPVKPVMMMLQQWLGGCLGVLVAFFFPFFVCVSWGVVVVWGLGVFCLFFERGCLCSFHWFDFQHLALKCSVSVLDEDTEINKNVLTLKLYEERCN